MYEQWRFRRFLWRLWRFKAVQVSFLFTTSTIESSRICLRRFGAAQFSFLFTMLTIESSSIRFVSLISVVLSCKYISIAESSSCIDTKKYCYSGWSICIGTTIVYVVLSPVRSRCYSATIADATDPELWQINRLIDRFPTGWSAMISQFFAVSPSNAKRIGVPPLLRTELALFLFVHSQACGIRQSIW